MPCYQIIGAARLRIIRDMILLALDALDAPNLSERSRLEAIAALAQAIGQFEGGAA